MLKNAVHAQMCEGQVSQVVWIGHQVETDTSTKPHPPPEKAQSKGKVIYNKYVCVFSKFYNFFSGSGETAQQKTVKLQKCYTMSYFT